MSHEPAHSAENERRQERALSAIDAIRRTGDEAAENAYFTECRRMCCEATAGLEFDAVRAVVWKDMVLGLGAPQPVPYLSQTIIRQERRMQRQHEKEESQRREPARADEHDDGAAVQRTIEDAAAPPTQGPSGSRTPPSRSHRANSSAATDPVANCADGRFEADREAGAAEPRRRRATSQVVQRVSTKTRRAAARAEGGGAAGPQCPPATAARPRPTVTLRLPENCQPRVVEADIQRSLWSLYPESTERDKMRRQLKEMLFRALASNPARYYYQGLHELMGFVMYVFAPYTAAEVTVSVCEGLLRSRWASFSEETLSMSEALLYATHAVIAEVDARLAMALEGCGVAPESHYAVSWVITWYAHCIPDTAVLGRLFDYFIIEEDGLNVVFFTAAYVVSQRRRILRWIADAEAEASEFGGDTGVITMAKVYALLTKMPADTLATASVADAAGLIHVAGQYREKYLGLVQKERQNFVNGNVFKLGYLANQRTRNAALRLLWSLLPREWRNPAKRREGVGRTIITACAVLAVALVVFSAKPSPDSSNGLFR